MKIRKCFVSNSSSSSFVILGVSLNDHPTLKEKFYDEEEWETPKNSDLLPPKTECLGGESGELILGRVLGGGSTDDGDFECEKISMDELKAYSDALELATGVKPFLVGKVMPS